VVSIWQNRQTGAARYSKQPQWVLNPILCKQHQSDATRCPPQLGQKEKFFEATRKQWETHKANAPEKYSDVSDQYITENNWEYFKFPQ